MAKRLDSNHLKQIEYENYDSVEDFTEQNHPETFRDVKEEVSKGKKAWNVIRPIVVFALSAFIVLFGVYYVVQNMREKYLDPVDINNTSTKEVTIARGSSLSKISETLYEEGIVRNKTIFKFYADFTDVGNKLKAGTYELSPSMTFDDIIYTLRKGMNASPDADVTLREGLNAEDFGAKLVEDEVLAEPDRYLELCKTSQGLDIKNEALLAVLEENIAKPESERRKYALEGYLFPDTYNFYKDSTASEVIYRQLNRFYEVIPMSYYTRAESMGMTLDQIITLASLIEKEAKEDDFAKVSAVFHNRLERGEPLGSDAALAYAFDIDTLIIPAEYLTKESPYNTHLNAGLPVGPIGNPGTAAIKAALYPDEEYLNGGYMFFALADPESGELVFTKTYEEHQQVQAEYEEKWREADERKKAEARGEVYVPPEETDNPEDGAEG